MKLRKKNQENDWKIGRKNEVSVYVFHVGQAHCRHFDSTTFAFRSNKPSEWGKTPRILCTCLFCSFELGRKKDVTLTFDQFDDMIQGPTKTNIVNNLRWNKSFCQAQIYGAVFVWNLNSVLLFFSSHFLHFQNYSRMYFGSKTGNLHFFFCFLIGFRWMHKAIRDCGWIYFEIEMSGK